MKKLFIAVVIAMLPVMGFAKGQGDGSPDFSGAALDGRQVSYAALKGKKPVYLMFWATW